MTKESSIFKKLHEKGIPGADRIHELFIASAHRNDFVLYTYFISSFKKWEKTLLTDEERELLYQMLNDKAVQILADLRKRPIASRDIESKCSELMKELCMEKDD